MKGNFQKKLTDKKKGMTKITQEVKNQTCEKLKETEKRDFTREEKTLFALFYASGKSVKESGILAGFEEREAEQLGITLLKLKSVKKAINRFRQASFCGEDGIKSGLMRLAFGQANDIMEVVLSDEPIGLNRLYRMNFFNVSEVKKVKGGGLEVKLFDRQKAMEKLFEIYQSENNKTGAEEFLTALSMSAGEDNE